MNTFPDLKRLLRKAGIQYQIHGERGLLVPLQSDRGQSGWGTQWPLLITVGTDNYCRFYCAAKTVIRYEQYRKQELSVEAYCFNCKELIVKMHRFGFLPENALARIRKVVDKEGYGYVRKKPGKTAKGKATKSKAVKTKQLSVESISKVA